MLVFYDEAFATLYPNDSLHIVVFATVTTDTDKATVRSWLSDLYLRSPKLPVLFVDDYRARPAAADVHWTEPRNCTLPADPWGA